MVRSFCFSLRSSPVNMSIRIWVTAKPQSKRQELKRISDGEYVVSIHAPAREGKANRAVIELLAAHFSVPKTDVKILRGHSGRKKLVEIG